MRAAARHAAVLAAFLVLAVLYSWPMPRHLTTHLLGVSGDDAGMSAWGLWHFRYALAKLHSNPFWTDLMYWPYGANLMLTNSMPGNAVPAFFLQPALGLPAAWNLLFLACAALSGWGLYLLLADWGFSAGIAFVCGAVFAFSPSLTLQSEWGRGLEFSCLNALPFYFWALLRAVRDRSLRAAALAGLCLTWAWSYNYYYFVIAALFIPFFYLWLEAPARVELVSRPVSPSLRAARRALEAGMALAAAWAVYALIAKGQTAWHGGGSARALLAYVAPYLCFWAMLAARLALQLSLRWSFSPSACGAAALRPYAAASGFWLALNLPLVAASLHFMGSGDYATAARAWRGGGDPLDPLWLVIPSVFQPLWRGALHDLLARLPFGQPGAASLGLLPLAGALWFWLKGPRDRWSSLWLASLAFCGLMCLGPWLKILGVHTYLPLPFYFLHLLPVYDNMSNGAYFLVFVMFFLALVFACFLKEVSARVPQRWACWVPVAAFFLVAFEFAPGSRSLFRIDDRPLLQRLAQRPDGAMLLVPVGAHFPRLAWSTVGRDWLPYSSQIVHRKPIVGGFLFRVARRTYETMSRDPFFQGLVAAQDGAAPGAALTDRALVARWLREMRLRYVLVDQSLVPEPLRKAMARWPLRRIDAEESRILYEVCEP